MKKLQRSVKELQTDPFSQLNAVFTHMPENTKTVYIRSINQFLDYFKIGINQLDTISPSDILQYIGHLKSIYSSSSINVKIAALKTLYSKLAIIQNLPNPFDTLKDLKAKTCFKTTQAVSRDKVLEETEIEEMLQYLKDNPSFVNTRNYCLIRLLYETGLRISEALGIKLKDIKPVNSRSCIVKITGKGHKEREVYILPDLYQKIKSICRGGYIFMSAKGNLLRRQVVHRIIKNLGKKLADKRISPHTFRHSFITHILEKHPEKIKAISRYAGHSSTSITLNMYVHNQVSAENIRSLSLG